MPLPAPVTTATFPEYSIDSPSLLRPMSSIRRLPKVPYQREAKEMNYRLRVLAANAIAAVLIMTAAGCAANRSAEQSQLAAARASAAADRAEASARAAEKAAHDATVATDRVEKVVREDRKAIDADVARINYLIALQQRRRRHRRKLRHRHHTPAVAAAPPTSTKPAEPTFIPPAD